MKDRGILRLAIPNIISNLSVPLLSAVDAALMGHLPGAEAYLSAIVIATGIFNFIYWGFGFLRMGTTGLAAQAFGAGNGAESLLILGRGLLVALGGGLLILLAQVPLAWAGFGLMNPAPEAAMIAEEYYDIRIWAAPATLALYVLHGWFLGMQNSIYPMLLAILANVLNLGLNLWFVQGLGMAAEGIALGTVISQYLVLLAAVGLLLYRYRFMFSEWQGRLLLQGRAMLRFFVVNRDIFIRTMCLVVVFNYFIRTSGSFGLQTQSANAILLQLLFVMSYLVDGFAFAAESLVGRFKGAGDLVGLLDAIRRIFRWGMGFALVFCLVYWLAGPVFLGLFTDKPLILERAMEFLPWMIVMPLVGAYSFIWDGVYLGATTSAPMRNSMLASTAAFFLVWMATGSFLGNHGLWLAMLVFMAFRGFTLALFARKNGLAK